MQEVYGCCLESIPEVFLASAVLDLLYFETGHEDFLFHLGGEYPTMSGCPRMDFLDLGSGQSKCYGYI